MTLCLAAHFCAIGKSRLIATVSRRTITREGASNHDSYSASPPELGGRGAKLNLQIFAFAE